MKSLSHDENIIYLTTASKYCLLQFGDETCGPCLAIRERLNRWLETHPDVTARYVPISEFRDISAQMGVFTAPTVRFYIEGRLVADGSGYFSLDRMLDKIERYLELE